MIEQVFSSLYNKIFFKKVQFIFMTYGHTYAYIVSLSGVYSFYLNAIDHMTYKEQGLCTIIYITNMLLAMCQHICISLGYIRTLIYVSVSHL